MNKSYLKTGVLEGPVQTGVDQFQLLGDLVHAVVVRFIDGVKSIEVILIVRTGSRHPDALPVDTSVTASRSVCVPHAVVEDQTHQRVLRHLALKDIRLITI